MCTVLICLSGNLSGQLLCLWVVFSSETMDSSSEPQRKIGSLYGFQDLKKSSLWTASPTFPPVSWAHWALCLSSNVLQIHSIWNGAPSLSCLANSDDSQSSAPISPQVKASCILSFLLSPGQITSSPSAFLYFLYSYHKDGIYHTVIIGCLLFC